MIRVLTFLAGVCFSQVENAESSKEMCTPAAVAPGDCGNGEAPVVGNDVNTAKGETSSASVAVAAPIADG